MTKLQQQIKTLPGKPGVYQMFDDKHRILYVGKAKNLKKRVASYFNKVHSESPKTVELVKRVVDFEVIVVEKEIEALILENELIKKHRPPFNVILRDDKTYLYIRVGVADPFPTISFVRRTAKDGAKYFGPYVDSRSARRVVTLLQRIFPLCTGGRVGRACLNYHIGTCQGVCVGEVSVEDYRKVFSQVVDFLNGKYGDALKDLEARMQKASANKKYELAARLRDSLQAVHKVSEAQSAVSPNLRGHLDVIGVATKANRSVVILMQVRRGKILNQLPFVMESSFEVDDQEIIEGFIRDYYASISEVPHLVLVPLSLTNRDLLNKWLTTLSTHKVEVVNPTRGLRRRLLRIANANAGAKFEEVASRLKLETKFAVEGLAELKKTLKLKALTRIEAYDISNVQGTDSVGAMVVFEKGRMDNQQYRRFKIRSVAGPDDYASLAEVLQRRFVKKDDDGRFAKHPELVMIDGGKGQVNTVANALGKFDFKLIGMAKGDHSAPKAKDEVVVWGAKKPLGLASNSPAKYLLQQIRDEAHRFALSYHTNLRKKTIRESALENIPGIGPATRKKLIKKFGSLVSVKEASEAELAKVVGENMAKKIRATF